MPALKIYGLARTRAFRVLWMVKELGLPYEHIPIETGPAGARKPEYLALNPNGRLPTIEDDGFVLWESLAINLYLAKKHSPGALYPDTAQGEARAWQWSLWAANEVERVTNIWSLHALRLPPEDRDQHTVNEALRQLSQPLGVLNQELSGRLYLLGSAFTVADLNVAAVLARAIHMDLSERPHLRAWLERCIERPAAREASRMREEAEKGSSVETIRATGFRSGPSAMHGALPLPCGERVGARGFCSLVDRNPSPGALRAPTSPYGRGEGATSPLRNDRAPH
jgi:glutathione S-transferase